MQLKFLTGDACPVQRASERVVLSAIPAGLDFPEAERSHDEGYDSH